LNDLENEKNVEKLQATEEIERLKSLLEKKEQYLIDLELAIQVSHRDNNTDEVLQEFGIKSMYSQSKTPVI
jgi:hypothetical protein